MEDIRNDVEEQIERNGYVAMQKKYNFVQHLANGYWSDNKLCLNCANRKKSNNHAIPRFMLNAISIKGMVSNSNALIDAHFIKKENGLAEAGAFSLLCNKCDQRLFKAYENPNNYEDEPNLVMLAQISLKNYLKRISIRRKSLPLIAAMAYQQLDLEYGDFRNAPRHIIDYRVSKITAINRCETLYTEYSFAKLREHMMTNTLQKPYLFYHCKVDYVTPIAFQSQVRLFYDFNGDIINNPSEQDNEQIEVLHICIFPLQSSTVIMMYSDLLSKKDSYAIFKASFEELDDCGKLCLINFLVFKYSDEYFIHKDFMDILSKNEELIKIAKEMDAFYPDDIINMEAHKNSFSLSGMKKIPNLLAPNNALKT